MPSRKKWPAKFIFLLLQIFRFLQTVRHLRRRQVWYRVIRPLQRRLYKNVSPPASALEIARAHKRQALFLFKSADRFDADTQAFTLLNIAHRFPGKIDWNEAPHGLLWAYHLNYFGWLEDEDLSVVARQETIAQFVAERGALIVGLSAYTISLRSLAWIRFFLKHGAPDTITLALLYQHLHRLYYLPEYEIDGNHLWENGCALIAGGLYFKENKFLQKGIEIMTAAGKDQLAADGMHIEGSPMYHSLLLLRTLMCIELSQKIGGDFSGLDFLKDLASKMLGWLEVFSFSDGSLAMVNDSTPGIAPPTGVLRYYTSQIGIIPTQPGGKGSYRLFRNENFELFCDVGNILPAWQPGHQHADTFSFCLHAGGIPVIVDTGISTYEEGSRRAFERSTAAHNTVFFEGINSSDVWKSFRTGRRASVKILSESADSLVASHDGYRESGIMHERSFRFEPNKIIIEDKVKGIKKQKALLHLHFHPGFEVKKIDENKFQARDLMLTLESSAGVSLHTYSFAQGFNKTTEAQRLTIEAEGYTRLTIERTHTSNAD